MLVLNRWLLFQIVVQQAIWTWPSVEMVNVKIGALFDHNANDATTMFRYAVKAHKHTTLQSSANEAGDNNRNYDVDDDDDGDADDPPTASSDVVHLQPIVADLDFGDELQATRRLCEHLKKGVAAVLGPMSATAAQHCTNVCDAMDVPYVDFRWDDDTRPPVINMMPHPEAMAQMFVALVRARRWNTFTILYESASWLPRAAALLRMFDPKDSTISVRRLVANSSQTQNFRPVLKAVRLSDVRHIMLECSADTLSEVLKQAMQVGLLTDQHQFIITTLDMHTIDLEPYKHSGVNLTGVRLVDPDGDLMRTVTGRIADDHRREQVSAQRAKGTGGARRSKGEPATAVADGLTAEHMLTHTALVYDAVLLLTAALGELSVEQVRTKRMACDSKESWENGNSITNFMRNTVVNGLSGEVKFDNEGLRSQFAIDVVELTADGLSTVGQWNSSTASLYWTRGVIDGISDSLTNKTFTVIIALNEPYAMQKKSAQSLADNDRYEGYCIDLIEQLSLMLGFNYTFRVQADGNYGQIVNGEWNGMIRELHENRADLAITDLTVTSERVGGADFTSPFMNMGISILYRKPTKEEPSILSFMSPFSAEVWMFLGAAYMGVSVCLFILGRISPWEWDNPYPCIEEPTVLVNQFSMRNAMWFAIGAILQQGTEIAPKSLSTRVVASTWWFFTLIIVSSYTANLAAFLTVTQFKTVLSSAEDLKDCFKKPDKCPVQFGAKRGGSTLKFFKNATYETYKNMYMYMDQMDDLMVKENDDGKAMVKNKSMNYAFLMESSSIEYIVERNCELTQVGRLLDDKGYGIAMRKNSSYRNVLSTAILRLSETGKLNAMKVKWWKEKNGGGVCEKSSDSDNAAEALGMHNMNGVFIVLLCGSTLATLIGIGAWFADTYRRSKMYNVSYKDELMSDLKFVVLCQGDTKTVHNRKSASLQTAGGGGAGGRRSRSADSTRRRSQVSHAELKA